MEQNSINSQYARPRAIPPEMGGSYDTPDSRLAGIMELMTQAPLKRGDKVLDIGLGRGQLSLWLSKKGLNVTGTGLELKSYDIGFPALQEAGIQIVQCGADKMPFETGTFDAVVMSHVLEHCPNVQLTLVEVRRVLKNGGHLFVFVPPHGPHVSAGHCSMGWNVGQLMYVLLLAGFSVRHGRFIARAGSVCGFVQKDSSMRLPPLRGDRGDIRILAEARCFPLSVKSRDGYNDGFWGNIGAINWDKDHFRHLRAHESRKRRVVGLALSFVPNSLLGPVSRILISVAQLMSEKQVNPPYLKG